jgi:hypothetical protein
MMAVHQSAGQEFAISAGRLIGHVLALVVGFVLMIAGLAMGVTVVLLPFGIPLGLVGLGLLVWGLFGWAREEELTMPPPQP